MKTTTAAVMTAIMLGSTAAYSESVGSSVSVRIVADDGHVLPTYPVKMKPGVSKVYAEAVKGDYYKIEVTNHLNRRVGLVVAVDGRNIISGGRSWLRNSERMYILEPYGSGEFTGWRTGKDRVNRFYFTDVPDSYAAAFGDESAMGVIAVAAYAEVQHEEPPPVPVNEHRPFYRRWWDVAKGGTGSGFGGEGRPAGAPPATAKAAPSERSEAREEKKAKAESDRSLDSAGTGYGYQEYSPVYTVEFEPERRPVESVYVKYEWKATLCKLGVVTCNAPKPRPYNRMWEYDGYAPPPPGRI